MGSITVLRLIAADGFATGFDLVEIHVGLIDALGIATVVPDTPQILFRCKGKVIALHSERYREACSRASRRITSCMTNP